MKSTKRAVVTVRFTVVRCSNSAQSAPTSSSGELGENATLTEGSSRSTMPSTTPDSKA